MKKIMILGAGEAQIPLIKESKKLGYKTLVTSIEGNYPGFEYGDEKIIADISKPKEILEQAKKHKIDGIATCCLNTGIESIGYVAEKLNLCNINYETGKLCKNKAIQKERFIKNNVSTAKYEKISSEKDLFSAFKKLNFPLIIKAVDLQGSKGIYIVHDKQETIDSFYKVMKETKESYCILEEFISGRVFGAEVFVFNNNINFIFIVGNIVFNGTTNVPIGHYIPIDYLSAEEITCAKNEITKAIKACGLNNCAVDIDLIVSNGKVYIIELTGRVGATCLPELVSMHYGINFYKMIAMMAMGEDPTIEFSKGKTNTKSIVAKMLVSKKNGIVENINIDKKLIDLTDNFSLIPKKNDLVKEFENAKDRIGQVIVSGNNLEECFKKIEKVQNNINIKLKE